MYKLILLFILSILTTKTFAEEIIKSQDETFNLEVIAEGFNIPWGMAILPDGRGLISDRGTGQLTLIDFKSGTKTILHELSSSQLDNNASMFDVILHPNYETNGWVYFTFSVFSDKGWSLEVNRAKLLDDQLIQNESLFKTLPLYVEDNSGHLGARVVLNDGYMFVSMGELYHLKEKAQTLDNHLGKIMRLYEDGKIPEDNPFINTDGALPEIWSYGHRNPQGMTIDRESNTIYAIEHGPQGGDEINVIEKSLNYGWPIITHGEEYGGGPIGDGITSKKGMEQPLYYYVPSIAPSGMTFYTGSEFPKWKGNLFSGALALTHLNRVVLKNGKVIREERMLEDKGWRIRFVIQGPDDCLYIGVDDGLIIRLSRN